MSYLRCQVISSMLSSADEGYERNWKNRIAFTSEITNIFVEWNLQQKKIIELVFRLLILMSKSFHITKITAIPPFQQHQLCTRQLKQPTWHLHQVQTARNSISCYKRLHNNSFSIKKLNVFRPEYIN